MKAPAHTLENLNTGALCYDVDVFAYTHGRSTGVRSQGEPPMRARYHSPCSVSNRVSFFA